MLGHNTKTRSRHLIGKFGVDLIVLNLTDQQAENIFEICLHLKKTVSLRNIPCILLVTANHSEHVTKGLEAGADGVF